MNIKSFSYQYDNNAPWQRKHKMFLRDRFEKFLNYQSDEKMDDKTFHNFVMEYIENHSTGINN